MRLPRPRDRRSGMVKPAISAYHAYAEIGYAGDKSALSQASILILVVDDEEDIRTMVSQALARLPGYEVHAATSKADAVTILSRQIYDLILTDLSMETASSGVELLQEVKQRAP